MDSVDKQCASIDFSNSCRQFYMQRVKATEDFKKQVADSEMCTPAVQKRTTTIDNAMETLRKEMASLMDQDLSLLKQLLTLNETIEEIKFKRLHASSRNSMEASSCYLGDSSMSIDFCNNEHYDVPKIEITAPDSSEIKTNSTDYRNSNNFVEKDIIICGKKRHIIHGRGNFSLDSGYDDADDYQTEFDLTTCT